MSNFQSAVPTPLRFDAELVRLDQRSQGVLVCGKGGSGKSVHVAQSMLNDYIRGVPVVAMDGTGGATDYFLYYVNQLPTGERATALERIHYVDLGSPEYVTPLPALYRLHADEPLYDVANRWLRILKTYVPDLIENPVMGWNAVYDLGLTCFMTLAALNCQITEATDFLHNPQKWAARLQQLPLDKNPELTALISSVEYFAAQEGAWVRKKVESLLNQLKVFSLDPTMSATFCSDKPGIDWPKVMKLRQVVLVDFRNIANSDHRDFLAVGVLDSLMSFIKHRGPGRHTPLALYVDDMSMLCRRHPKQQQWFAEELSSLIHIYSRSSNIWPTLITQELSFVPPSVLPLLMAFGAQVIGCNPDLESSEILAKSLIGFDPDPAKPVQVYTSDPVKGRPSVVDQTTADPSLHLKLELWKLQIRSLSKFKFLVRSCGEGGLDRELRRVSLAGVAKDGWPQREVIGELRNDLLKKHGTPIEHIRKEIEERQAALTWLKQPLSPTKLSTAVFSQDTVWV